MISVFLILISLLSGASFAGIYGPDNRVDYFDIKNPIIQNLAKSTPIIVDKKNLLALPDGTYKILPKNLMESSDMCSDALFSSQPILGHCSATLIEKDVIITAGHCFSPSLKQPSNYQEMYVIFDYLLNDPSQTEIIIKSENVFEIKELLYYHFPPLEIPVAKGFKDLSLARLDRATNRTPIKMNTAFNYAKGTKLFMLGYPMGLPLKYTDDAEILKLDRSQHAFHHQLDAFSSNSGSAIYDEATNEIIGVMVRGESMNTGEYGRSCSEWYLAKDTQVEHGTLLWDLAKIKTK
jgi:V8-like Glu-specific endopeptidase